MYHGDMTARVRIDSLAFGGWGVGRLAGGKAVLVEAAAPGDLVEIHIERDRRSHATASIKTIIEPSPDRVDPPCDRAGRCGGCTWLHLPASVQRSWKRTLVTEALSRAGLDAGGIEEVQGGAASGYRTRARLHLRRGVLGTMQRRSHAVVPFASCPVLAPDVEALAADLAESVDGADLPDSDVEVYADALGQRGMLVTTSGPARGWDAAASRAGVFSHRVRRPRSKSEAPEGRLLFEDSAGALVAFEPGVFVQTNREANGMLAREVARAAGEGRSFAEVYAGAGNLTVHLARAFTSGSAAEHDPAGARMLRRNLRALDTPVSVHEEADAASAKRLAAGPAADALVVDPPRSGMRPLYGVLDSAPPARVVMVSCHPMAAVRDIARMVRSAGYRLERVVPIDMFPNTAHLEIVALLAP